MKIKDVPNGAEFIRELNALSKKFGLRLTAESEGYKEFIYVNNILDNSKDAYDVDDIDYEELKPYVPTEEDKRIKGELSYLLDKVLKATNGDVVK